MKNNTKRNIRAMNRDEEAYTGLTSITRPHTQTMQRTRRLTLLAVLDSINSAGARILHHLLPWLPLLFLLITPPPPRECNFHGWGPCCHSSDAASLRRCLSSCRGDGVFLAGGGQVITCRQCFCAEVTVKNEQLSSNKWTERCFSCW